jgi:hypothetical protein
LADGSRGKAGLFGQKQMIVKASANRPPGSERHSHWGRQAVKIGSMNLVPRLHERAMAENGIEHLRVLIANE